MQRRLTKQQSRRVWRKQEERLQRPQKNPVDGASDPTLGPEEQGTVVANFGQSVEVEPLTGADDRKSCLCHVRANIDTLVAGDRVVWRRGQATGIVVAKRPRSTELQRPDRRGRLRTVAANIDGLMLVIAPEPLPHANLVDRYLVGAEHTGLQVTIVANKEDLLIEGAPPWLREFESVYPSIGYPMLRASTRTKHGLDCLSKSLVNRTTVLVGQSGVGKSSLVGALLPDVNPKTATLSAAESKGRHTTSAARLYHLPGGGNLIDSPGIREFAMTHLDAKALAEGFVEMRPYLGRCQFRDCRHIGELNCAVIHAVVQGLIHQGRHESYCQILEDLAQ